MSKASGDKHLIQDSPAFLKDDKEINFSREVNLT